MFYINEINYTISRDIKKMYDHQSGKEELQSSKEQNFHLEADIFYTNDDPDIKELINLIVKINKKHYETYGEQ